MRKDRQSLIYEQLQTNQQVLVDALAAEFHVSEATIRRDLQEMEDMKLCKRFYGGAFIHPDVVGEPSMDARHLINTDQKINIAKYAASLIKNNDIVYLDAGTTTEKIVDFIYAKNIIIYTQALSIMQKLYERQIKCYTFGGYIRFNTNIIVDNDTIEKIANSKFNISFLGANGIHPLFGFSTTNEIEASLKKAAIEQSLHAFILADSSKFNYISNIKFADTRDASVITNEIPANIDPNDFKDILCIHR